MKIIQNTVYVTPISVACTCGYMDFCLTPQEALNKGEFHKQHHEAQNEYSDTEKYQVKLISFPTQ